MKRKLSILVLALALVFTFSFSAFALTADPAQTPGKAANFKEDYAEASAINLYNDTKAGKYKLISTDTLHKQITAGKKMVIVDTMPAGSYNTANGHIPSKYTINVEVGVATASKAEKANLKKAVKAAAQKINKKNYKKVKVVVYCGFTSCRRSHWGAKALVDMGYKNVYRQPGGITAWKDAGYTVEPESANTPATTTTTTTPAAQ